PARVRGAGLPGAPQERGGHPRDARPGRVEGARPRPHQRDRRLHHAAPPQAGAAWPVAPHPHGPRRRLQSAGGAMSLSIRWRLTLWNALALGAVLLGFAALVYALLRHALYERVDRALRTEFRELAEEQAADDYEGRLRHWIDELKEHENF